MKSKKTNDNCIVFPYNLFPTLRFMLANSDELKDITVHNVEEVMKSPLSETNENLVLKSLEKIFSSLLETYTLEIDESSTNTHLQSALLYLNEQKKIIQLAISSLHQKQINQSIVLEEMQKEVSLMQWKKNRFEKNWTRKVSTTIAKCGQMFQK